MIRRHRHRHDRKSKRHDRGKSPLLAIFVHFVMYFFIMHIDSPIHFWIAKSTLCYP